MGVSENWRRRALRVVQTLHLSASRPSVCLSALNRPSEQESVKQVSFVRALNIDLIAEQAQNSAICASRVIPAMNSSIGRSCILSLFCNSVYIIITTHYMKLHCYTLCGH